MRQQLHWFALHGFVRHLALVGTWRGDPLGRLIADPAVFANPRPFCDELHAQGPLVRVSGGYLAVGHAVARQILRSKDFRLPWPGSTLPGPLRWLEDRTRPDLLHPLRPPSLLAVEAPDHTRYRAALAPAFTQKAVAALHNRIAEIASNLLDRLANEPGPVDLVDEYCWQVPVVVLSDVLGVPDRDQEIIREFCEVGAPILDAGLTWRQYRRVQEATEGICAWLKGHVRRLMRSPGDDLISELILRGRSGSADIHLTETELQAMAGLLLTAGSETTVNLLGSAIQMLLDAPEHVRELRQQPQLWSHAIQEILRLEPPVQVIPRVALRDTEVGRTAIRRGAVILTYVPAVNRDPSVFDDPHRFDIRRENAMKHLCFASGHHVCLGATLARDEAAIGLRTLFERFPEMRVAGTQSRRESRVLRGWAKLPVQLVPAKGLLTAS
ncbi:cytochrome P450 [Mycobacterium intermedium]|uniref:Cytochrome P450 n=1 Tax=Mycobacterium intermedium TaxID=28445 RepID=A0A1E3S992_MYCIE|nr:cytochrome P450 [Mycobacterium intermedium]MCV6967819.1 cytochrome P450 [Mycobacterium intermedium]ODQ98641.1 cytochrome [Mycobacterium intermedium]OPE50835.1 cytochrome P450 [Mycobacterium intermedium]ORB06586.1 cytochrome P450 [Mycobacterium intermedium]